MFDSETGQKDQATRLRLLEAAGEVFGEVGFNAATVRDICQRAGANVAAVNYHFGGKEKLYEALLRYSWGYANESPAAAEIADRSASPRDRLRAFVADFLGRILGRGRPAWHGKLVSREMIDPTPALDHLVEQDIRPRAEQLRRIIADLLGPKAESALIRRCANSVAAQCLYYHHSAPVIRRLNPEIELNDTTLAELAEHISQFSLAALEGIARTLENEKAR